MRETRVVTHLGYTELFKTFERKGVVLFSSSLKTVNDIEDQIQYLLESMNPVELIQFTSFLNMICQTGTAKMTMIRGVTFLEESKVVPKGTRLLNKIVFHRENLLNLISQIIEKKIQGIQPLTGRGHIENQNKYCKAILFNNDLLGVETNGLSSSVEENFLREYFIREWPHYYLFDLARDVNRRRILRYRYCYEILLQQLEGIEKDNMEECIKAFEEKSGVSLQEYMKVLNKLFTWFCEMPYQNIKNPPASGQPKFGFDFMNIYSFYIDSKKFVGDPSFIKIIDNLSSDLDTLREAVEKESERDRDLITGYNKNIRVFFNNPIFKISDDYYCVVDMKFLLDNACGGLLFRVVGDGNDLRKFKPAYGRLMEEYFKFLVRNIFKSAKITFGGGAGADAIVEQADKILVIEFTTEYYRQSSLYNSTSQGFIDDVYRILFNDGKSDTRSRGKADKGKLIKLEGYIEKSKSEGKIIVPVLVTENILGDHDLINAFSNLYDTEIANKNLVNLQQNPPLFLCLDDLETFWALFEPKESVKGFTDFAKEWIPANKGPQFHNASAGISRFVEKQKGETIVTNSDYADFFSPKQIFK